MFRTSREKSVMASKSAIPVYYDLVAYIIDMK